MPRRSPQRTRLTQKFVASLKPVGKHVDHFDDQLPGFHVRVELSGARTFALRYRDPEGGRPAKYHRLILGRFGELTVDQARGLAQDARYAVRQGQNPARERRARRAVDTVDDVVQRYLEKVRAHYTPRVWRQARSAFHRFVNPPADASGVRPRPETGENWGPRPARGVTHEDVRALHLRLHDRPMMANRIVTLLHAAFAHAEIEPNPASTRKVLRYKATKRARALEPHERQAIGEALRSLQRDGLAWQGIAIIRLLFLTGWRSSEARTLRWDALDLERGRVLLRHTKTGFSERPLGAATIELLEQVRPLSSDSPYCFPSDNDASRPWNGLQRAWELVRERAQLPTLRLHDLRHDLATDSAAAHGAGITMALTGHKSLAAATGYVHEATQAARAAASALGRARAAALDGTPSNEPTPPDDPAASGAE